MKVTNTKYSLNTNELISENLPNNGWQPNNRTLDNSKKNPYHKCSYGGKKLRIGKKKNKTQGNGTDLLHA